MRKSTVGSLPDLWKETYDLVAQVPEGMVTTYGEVARALGDVVASRFVGLAMSRNDDIVRVPCRRVVQSDGHLGGYTGGGPRKKAALLRREGIGISNGKVKNLDRVLFKDFRTRYPLRGLRAKQLAMKRRLCTEDSGLDFTEVAGIDVAYSDDRAFAAMVVIDARDGRKKSGIVREGVASFPYVPTYLAFREMPVVGGLVEELEDATVVVYDGNGILHPEGFGIASQFGVSFDVPTIGVAKKLLCGSLGGASRSLIRPVTANGELLGHALSKRAGARPVFVSAGHMVSSGRALEVSRRFLAHRVPEPTRLAHIEAEAARRARSNK